MARTNLFKFVSILIILAGTLSFGELWSGVLRRSIPPGVAMAEKEEFYTSSEEFLPLGADIGAEQKGLDTSFLKDDTLIHEVTLAGIKLLKDEDTLLFLLKSEDTKAISGRKLKHEVLPVNFPPRIILRLYGVKSEENIFRFFKNLKILGIARNPFQNNHVSEYIIFFADWMEVSARYSLEERMLRIDYHFAQPPYKRGYGVRIADTKIDPLPHVVEIHRELGRYNLDNYLLIASDHETVILESPFYRTKEEAVSYMEALEGFGYKGKLAIRDYLEFPQPHRFDVVSEAVIIGEDDINLKDIVYGELLPEKIYIFSYEELYRITKEIFSLRVQNDKELISEYYYKLSEIYRNYNSPNERERRMAFVVSLKLLEIIYFHHPSSARADDALWELASSVREFGVKDVLSEEECYRKIVKEYPRSIYYEESKARLGQFERGSAKPPARRDVPPKKGQK